MIAEKDLYNLATEMGQHNRILWIHYIDFNPDIRIALSGLIETFMFLRVGGRK